MSDKRARYLERNAGRPCEFTGCHRPRHQTSRWCSNHARKVAAYGHPKGAPLTRADLAPFNRDVAAFLKRQAGNEFIAAAEAELTLFIRTELPRLREAGIDGPKVLPLLLAVWTLNDFAPLKSDDAFTFALARAVLTTVPRQTYRSRTGALRSHPLRARVLRKVGSFVRSHPLSTFLSTAAKAVLASSTKAAHRRSVLAKTTFDEPAPLPAAPVPVAPPARRQFRIRHS